MADSDEEIIGLLEPKMETAEMTIKDIISEQIFSDGLGNDGKDLDGLMNGIDDGSSYATYGGINRTTETWWKSSVDTTGGAMSLDMLGSAHSAASSGTVKPDLFILPEALWNKLETRVQPTQRFVKEDLAKVGFSRGFQFRGADVLPDEFCPSGTFLTLNTDFIQLAIHPARSFYWTEPKTPVDQDAYVRQLLLACNLVVTAPWRQRKNTNVT
jgi:hypothetical protein